MFAPLLLVSILLVLAPFPATPMENFGIQLRDGLQAFTSGNPHADICYETNIHPEIGPCMKAAIRHHPFTTVSPDKVDEDTFKKMKTSGCAARKESIECVNKAACTKCNYDGAKALKYWYQQQEKELATDCAGTKLVKACQDNLKPSANPTGPGNNGKTTTSKSSTTLIIVIVVVVIVLVVVAVAVYCLFCKKDDSKASKESGGAKSSAPKSARPSQVASSPMGAKSSALAVGKSAVKSSLAGGGAKSAAKSSLAGGKSQAKSAAGLKATSKAKSKV